jgi:hypothetical protein
MRRWWAGVLVALVMGPTAARSAPAEPFRRLEGAHWSYAAVRTLERHGYATGAPRGAFDGGSLRTRYDFAVAVERIYRVLQPRVLAASTPGTLGEDIATFERLLREFSSELAGQGRDVREIEQQVAGLEARVDRLARTASDSVDVAAGSAPVARRSRVFGLRNALGRTFVYDPLGLSTKPDLLVSPTLARGNRLSAAFGPARLGLQVKGADGLDTTPNLPLQDPSQTTAYRAQFGLPLGSYLLAAFYGRQPGNWDRYGLWNPYLPQGAIEGLGGSVSGSLTDRLAISLEAASLRPLDDNLARMLYFRGDLSFALGGGFDIGVDYERTQKPGVPGQLSSSALRVGKKFGSARLDLLLRHHVPGRSEVTTGSRDLSNYSAITQFTVRF